MNKRGPNAMLRQNFSSLGRVVRKLFGYYPRLAPLAVVLVLFSSAVSSIPSLFVQNVLAVIEKWYKTDLACVLYPDHGVHDPGLPGQAAP